MATTNGISQRITNMLTQSDYFRRSPSRLGGPGDHKEWQHFILHTQALHLLINFSLVNEFSAKQRAIHEVGRLIIMARRSHWDGDVDRFDLNDVKVTAGKIDARFGDNLLRFQDGRYYLNVRLRNRPISAELEMIPASVPTMSSNQPLSRTRNISWLFVPRLRCSGNVTIDGGTVQVNDALAYHDHNWGHFKWDDDYSWEWGSALPIDNDNPISVVYMRMCDRARTVCRSQALYIGYEGEQLRFFRDQQMKVTLRHRFEQEKCLQVPRVMAMLSPGLSRDIPGIVEIQATGDGDDVRLSFVLEDLSQLVLPSETRIDGITSINEVSGKVKMTGVAKGKRLEMDGRGIFEFIRN
jgi:hypothetical protein